MLQTLINMADVLVLKASAHWTTKLVHVDVLALKMLAVMCVDVLALLGAELMRLINVCAGFENVARGRRQKSRCSLQEK